MCRLLQRRICGGPCHGYARRHASLQRRRVHGRSASLRGWPLHVRVPGDHSGDTEFYRDDRLPVPSVLRVLHVGSSSHASASAAASVSASISAASATTAPVVTTGDACTKRAAADLSTTRRVRLHYGQSPERRCTRSKLLHSRHQQPRRGRLRQRLPLQLQSAAPAWVGHWHHLLRERAVPHRRSGLDRHLRMRLRKRQHHHGGRH